MARRAPSAFASTAGVPTSGSGGNLTYTLTIPTSVVSIVRTTPSATLTNATSVIYTATFADSVSGLASTNFSLTTTGSISGASIASVTGSGTTWTVTVNTGTGDGTLTLNLANSTGITPPVSNTPFTMGDSYTIDKTAPTVTSSPMTLPAATYGQAYGPVTFTAMDTNMPTITGAMGLPPSFTFTPGTGAMANTGTLSGTPTSTTAISFTVQASDAAGNTANMPFSITVSAAAPGFTVTTTPMSGITYSQSVTFSAAFTPLMGMGIMPPTGSVAFTTNSGMTTLCTIMMLDSMGSGSCQSSALPVGTGETITWTYTPAMSETNYATATGTIMRDVSVANTTLALAGMPMTGTVGQSVTLTATITANSPATATPTGGTVTFYDGAANPMNQIGLPASVMNGTASVMTSSLTAGNHQITAVYSGGGNFGGSTAGMVLSFTVTQSAPTVTLGMTTPTRYGQSVSFTATVTGVTGVATPTGTVTFTSSDGAVLNGGMGVALVPVMGSNPPAARATVSTSALKAGMDTITATYVPGSDPNYTAGMAATVTQTVNPATTTTAVTSSSGAMNPTSAVGQSVTFTATVTNTATGTTPTGTVAFTSSDGTMLTGVMTSATGNTLTATVSTSALKAGMATITATYVNSDGNFAGSMGTVIQAVGKLTSSVSVASNSAMNTSALGQSVTFTATVSGGMGNPTPTGSVSFTNGSTMLGSAMLDGTGKASVSTTVLPVGMDAITVSYSGDATYATSTGMTTQTVTGAAVTSLTVTAPTGSGSNNSGTASMPKLAPGQSLTLTVMGSYTNGTMGSVSGVTYMSSDPTKVTVDATGKLMALAPGTVTIMITAPNGVTTTITVTVSSVPTGGLMNPNPQPMTHPVAPTVAPTPMPSPQPQPIAHPTSGAVQPNTSGGAPTATPLPQPAQH